VVGVVVVALGLSLPHHHTPRMYPTSRGGSWRQWEVWWWWVSSSCWACHCHVTTHPAFRRPIVPAPLVVLTIVRSTRDPPCEQLLTRLGAGARSSSLSTLLGCPSVAVPFIVSFVSWGILRRGRGVHTWLGVPCSPSHPHSVVPSFPFPSSSSLSFAAPVIHPASSCSQGWGWVLVPRRHCGCPVTAVPISTP
jgi:hypothetical protein